MRAISSRASARRAAVVAAAATAIPIVLVHPAVIHAQSDSESPVATYWATATTSSGITAGSPGALLSGGGSVQRELQLQLESSRAAAGEPTAEHFPPEGLRVGPRLPLHSPRQSAGTRTERAGSVDGGGAKGRMLIYWGCGAQVRAGQPLVIDFADLARGGGGLPDVGIRTATGPSVGAGRTYGEWPNEKSRVRVPGAGSLVGDHLVRGNYTPDIRFSLSAGQDFMGDLRLTGVADHERGPVPLGWQALREAKAYFAYAMGSADGDDIVVWSSSETAIAPGAVPDHLAPAVIDGLVRREVLLPAKADRCEIPAAVAEAAPQAMVRVIAFGNEVNTSFPQRPDDSRTPWKPEYVVKVRYASTASTILGMPELSQSDDEAEDAGDDAASGAGNLLRRLSPLGGIRIKSPFGKSRN